VERLLSRLNSVKPSIQFIFEQESERCLPSLDVNILRTEERNRETSVYCKPTHTDKYFGFDSHHLICHKKFVTRTLHLWRKRSANVHCLKGQSLPENFHSYCCQPVPSSLDTLVDEVATAGFSVVPFLHGITEPIKRILASHNVKVAQKPFQTLGHIFSKPKDCVPRGQQTNSVDSIPCKVLWTCTVYIRQIKGIAFFWSITRRFKFVG